MILTKRDKVGQALTSKSSGKKTMNATRNLRNVKGSKTSFDTASRQITTS